MNPTRFAITAVALACFAGVAAAGPNNTTSTTADATVLIDQAKALAGNVTAGDAAGFPITISRPGSYKLMGPLTVPAGVHGIEITSSDVTVDLNGFTVSGPLNCAGSHPNVSCGATVVAAGVAALNSSHERVTVRNGGVRGFSHCVNLGGSGRASELALDDCGIALGTGYGSLANGLTISNAETGLYLYGTVAESVQMRNVNRGATAGASLFDRVSVYGASVGFYSMTDSSRSSVRNAVFLGATPFVGALSLGGNLCNGAAC